MSKNGFFHERPDDYDIDVAPNMREVVGSALINWHVINARYQGSDVIADVEWNGHTYTAKDCRRDGAADALWTIIE